MLTEVSLTEEEITRNGCKTLVVDSQGIQRKAREGLKKPQPDDCPFPHLGERSEQFA